MTKEMMRWLLLPVLPLSLLSRTISAQASIPAGLESVPQPTVTTSRQSISPVHATGASRYARYTPLFCSIVSDRVGANATTERLATWHDRWPQGTATRQADSAYFSGAEHATKSEARACLGPVTAAKTSPYHLWSLGNAWLAVDEDESAAEAFTRLLKVQAKAPLLERAWWLQRLVGVYMSPVNLTRQQRALDYLAQLDALGPSAAGFQLAARNAMYSMVGGIDSIPWMIAQARDAIALSQTLTGDVQREWLSQILQAFVNHAEVDVRQRRYQAAIDTLESARKRYGAIDPFRLGILMEPLSRARVLVKEPLVPVTKPSFFYVPGQIAAIPPTTTWPVKGKVTLFIRAIGGTRLIGSQDFSVYRFALRVREKFGDQVDIVTLARTKGNYAGRLVSDSVEAGHVRELVHDYMRLPFPLVVFAERVTGKDEYARLIRERDPHFFAIVTLVDKRGVIRDYMNGLAEMRWMKMLDEMVREPAP